MQDFFKGGRGIFISNDKLDSWVCTIITYINLYFYMAMPRKKVIFLVSHILILLLLFTRMESVKCSWNDLKSALSHYNQLCQTRVIEWCCLVSHQLIKSVLFWLNTKCFVTLLVCYGCNQFCYVLKRMYLKYLFLLILFHGICHNNSTEWLYL